MSYKINKTDGSLLKEIIDSEIDQVATDLTLIGKNVTGYGEYINENFVKLLENFASTAEPNNPIAGQIWFDLTDNRLKVYNGNGFIIASGPVVSSTQPLTLGQGDFWIDNQENQLYFNDGLETVLVGPDWKRSDGRSGIFPVKISDNFGNIKLVNELRSGGVLLGYYSSHAEFIPIGISNYLSGSIKPGFNSANIDEYRFNAVASSAESLIDGDGNLQTADSFLTSSGNNTTSGILNILNATPLKLGVNQETLVNVTTSAFNIRSNWNNQDFKITTRASNNFYDAITVKASTNSVGIFNSSPTATLDVTGDVVVSGNLTVNGATTTINSTTLTIDDKQIILASTASPSDATADGGGLVLKGTTDHSILWEQASDRWNFTESINLPTGSDIQINGVSLISETALAASITSATGLSEIGTLESLAVDNIIINDNTISTTTGSLILSPSGISAVDVTNSRIINVYPPAFAGDAVNKGYVDELIGQPWAEVAATSYQASAGEQIFASTGSGSIYITLPETVVSGNVISFLDYDGTFDLTPLFITRYRRIDESTLAGDAATTGDFPGIPTVNLGPSTGSGLVLTVNISASGTYLPSTVAFSVVNHGFGYRNGDTIIVLGTSLGGTSPTNDMTFVIRMDNILSIDDDFVVNDKNSAFSLVYTNSSQGWRFTEQLTIPAFLDADVKGNVFSKTTSGLILDTSTATAILTGNVTGNLLGNVNGNVTGNITGTVLTAAQPNITSVGTLTGLTVSTPINGNLLGNVTGTLSGNVNGAAVTAPGTLTLSSVLNDLRIKSGRNGIIISAVEDTGVQEQYAIRVTPGTSSGNKSTTLLFGDVVVANQTGANVNGASFRLPSYSAAQLAARTLSFLNYGELIYNTTDGKVQAYVDPGVWTDLH